MKLEVIFKNLVELNKVENHVKVHDELEVLWKNTTKMSYDLIKMEEKSLGLSSTGRLQNLHIKNMNSEQVWQQLELQNGALMSDISKKGTVENTNLCVMIANLTNIAHAETEDKPSEEQHSSDDEGVETGDEVDFSEANEPSPNSDEDTQSQMEDKEENEDDFSEFSDLDADTFGDIALNDDNEEDDTDDDEEDKEENSDMEEDEAVKKNKNSETNQMKFKGSSVDSKFLNLRESEYVADKDLIGKELNKDLDLFQGESEQSDNQDEPEAMYDDFFDPPNDQEVNEKDDAPVKQDNVEEKEQKVPSTFETSLNRNQSVHENLVEKYYLGEDWTLKGEVEKDQRPENSALEEHVEYNVAIRHKPIITEETTKQIENLLLTRIRNQHWDDVERRIKPTADPFQFKKKIILDQEKNKKSLSAIYEEEFLKTKNDKSQTGTSILLASEEKGEELPIHKEIKSEMDSVFTTLDALFNYHYTPKYKNAEIKVVSNLPAVTLEESTPTTASDATLLAPQEVVAPLRGDLKGESEKTSTDKKRERRSKKNYQKAKAKMEESKLKHKLKKTTKDGIMQADASVQVVQKAVKKGQIKMLDGAQNKSLKSIGVFNHLQDISDKKRKNGDKDGGERKKWKRSKELTMAKLLL